MDRTVPKLRTNSNSTAESTIQRENIAFLDTLFANYLLELYINSSVYFVVGFQPYTENQMRYPFGIKFSDPGSILRELDRFQLERMIWLRLAASKKQIARVEFIFERSSTGGTISVKGVVRFRSGHKVKAQIVGQNVDDLLLDITDELKSQVTFRLWKESLFLFRMATAANHQMLDFTRWLTSWLGFKRVGERSGVNR